MLISPSRRLEEPAESFEAGSQPSENMPNRIRVGVIVIRYDDSGRGVFLGIIAGGPLKG